MTALLIGAYAGTACSSTSLLITLFLREATPYGGESPWASGMPWMEAPPADGGAFVFNEGNSQPGATMLNPGDPKAHEAGCKCPAEPNRNGEGIDGGQAEIGFLVVKNCPLHGESCWMESSE